MKALRNTDLYALIPQRPPIVMVDLLQEVSAADARTGLTVAEDNIFVADGVLQEPGVIEHIAQSAAAFLGYASFAEGLPPRVGYIGEVRKMHFGHLPQVGSQLETHLHILAEAAGITLLEAETRAGDETVARGEMKIFLQEDGVPLS